MLPLVIVILAVALALRVFVRGTSASSDAIADSSEHAFPCPACGYDLRASAERCPECGTLVPSYRRPLDPKKLRDDWPLSPITPREPGMEETLVRVWDAPSAFAARLLVYQFEQRGIRAVVSRSLPPMAVGNYIAPAADHAVAVWSADVDAAAIILDRFATL